MKCNQQNITTITSRAAQNICNPLFPPAPPSTMGYTSELHIKRAGQFVTALLGMWLQIDVLSGDFKPSHLPIFKILSLEV